MSSSPYSIGTYSFLLVSQHTTVSQTDGLRRWGLLFCLVWAKSPGSGTAGSHIRHLFYVTYQWLLLITR